MGMNDDVLSSDEKGLHGKASFWGKKWGIICNGGLLSVQGKIGGEFRAGPEGVLSKGIAEKKVFYRFGGSLKSSAQ